MTKTIFAGGAFTRIQDAASDTTPNAFSISDKSGVARSTVITSDAFTPTGYDAAAAISVSGGEYELDASGSWVSTPGTINPGQSVRVRHTSSASYLTATNTTLTIGGVSDIFTSITQGNPANAAYLRRPFSFNWWTK